LSDISIEENKTI